MTDDLQIGDQRLMLQMRTSHGRVVTHERACVQKHAEHGQKANPPAQQHPQFHILVAQPYAQSDIKCNVPTGRPRRRSPDAQIPSSSYFTRKPVPAEAPNACLSSAITQWVDLWHPVQPARPVYVTPGDPQLFLLALLPAVAASCPTRRPHTGRCNRYLERDDDMRKVRAGIAHDGGRSRTRG